MIERLARLADRRAKRVLALAAVFFVVAGALGAGVADRLDPYGADDPDDRERDRRRAPRASGLPRHRHRGAGRGRRPDSDRGRARLERLASKVEADPDVAQVSSFATTGARDFVSRGGDSTYLAVALEPTDDDALQDAAERIADSLEGEPGVSVGGSAVAQKQVNEQVEKDLRTGRAVRLPAAVPAVAAVLPQRRGRAAAAARRRPGHRRHLPDAARRERADLGLHLRPQPRHRPRPRARDRLQPVHRLALSRGDRAHRPGPGRDAAHARDGRPHGAVQLADGRRRARLAAGLPAALPLLDGHRRLLRRADRRGDRADRAAGRADPARRPRERAHPGVPGAPRGARRPAGARRLLVPPLAVRDALPRPHRRGHGGAADRARPPLPRHHLHVGRRPGAARVRERAPGRRHAARRVPALPRHAGDARRDRRRRGGGARCRAGRPACPAPPP